MIRSTDIDHTIHSIDKEAGQVVQTDKTTQCMSRTNSDFVLLITFDDSMYVDPISDIDLRRFDIPPITPPEIEISLSCSYERISRIVKNINDDDQLKVKSIDIIDIHQ